MSKQNPVIVQSVAAPVFLELVSALEAYRTAQTPSRLEDAVFSVLAVTERIHRQTPAVVEID